MPLSADDLFEVELLEPLAEEPAAHQPRKLPGRAAPLPGEALASWLLRYAEPFGLSPEELLFRVCDAELAGDGEWWRRPHPALIERLAQATGVDPPTITNMTFAAWSGDDADDDMRERFSWQRFHLARPTHRQQRRIAVCPLCLTEDEPSYVRRDWMLGWAAVCPAHNAVLVTDCPDCGVKLRIPGLNSREYLAPDRCPRCSFRLANIPPRSAHRAAVALQERLIEARGDNALDLPGHDPVPWPVAIALLDVLLGAVWIDTRVVARRRLFARIERDFGCDVLGTEPTTSYDGLLILAWMLEGWPDRVRAAIAILQGPRPRRQLERWRDLDGGVGQAVLGLLIAVWPDESHPDDRAWWRAWIDTLPETGDQLRARAAIDRFAHRRARMLALADVRDGMPVELAAEAAGVTPRTLYIWLRRGTKDGLESALDRQRGALNQAQAIEIADWIANAPTNQPRWRITRVRNEVFRRFGLEISGEVASRLLRHHGPWTRRRLATPRRKAKHAPVAE